MPQNGLRERPSTEASDAPAAEEANGWLRTAWGCASVYRKASPTHVVRLLCRTAGAQGEFQRCGIAFLGSR